MAQKKKETKINKGHLGSLQVFRVSAGFAC
jgi:hypothetical protein